MTDDDTNRTGRLGGVASTAGRVVADLLVVSLWVLFLTLLFLSVGWPRWAFYLLLLGGVGLYVSVTSGWWTGVDTPAER